MNPTLKTYDDGSELTLAGAGVLAAICVITGTLGAVTAVKYQNWKERRMLKKMGITPNNM